MFDKDLISIRDERDQFITHAELQKAADIEE